MKSVPAQNADVHINRGGPSTLYYGHASILDPLIPNYAKGICVTQTLATALHKPVAHLQVCAKNRQT